MHRMLVCARCKLWWMTPEWRTSTLQLPPETQFLLAELKPTTSTSEELDHDVISHNSKRKQPAEGHYALLLPLIDGDFRCTLRPGR
jgi:raffinose synthase